MWSALEPAGPTGALYESAVCVEAHIGELQTGGIAGRGLFALGGGEILERAGPFPGEAGLIVGHEPVISYAGYILARQEDRGVADRGVPTATALVLSFEGAWENLAPGTCAMRVFYTPPTR